ncbi:MAG: hypothetical protein J7M30_08505, partial [Deltaproteobacteria bacterium]|nr:hypothetical protein [Deltaproteobacteria bacterium]
MKTKNIGVTLDGLVKSQKTSFFVIPAEAGIQYFQELMPDLDPGFRRGDDFLQVHHSSQHAIMLFLNMIGRNSDSKYIVIKVFDDRILFTNP